VSHKTECYEVIRELSSPYSRNVEQKLSKSADPGRRGLHN